MTKTFSATDFQEKTGVSRETLQHIQLYADLLQKWQKQINLVSNSTLPDMWARHFYDSAQLMDHLRDQGENLKILDIGSGAGFPGLLLSIMGAGEAHMVESSMKKCTFMKEIIRRTGAAAFVHSERVEEMTPFPVDVITSRACAGLDKLLDLGKNFITADTVCLFLKGQTAQSEIDEAHKRWDFNVKKYTSRTNESGTLLKLSCIKACDTI